MQDFNNNEHKWFYRVIMNNVLYVCLVVFSLFTLVSCGESEKDAFQNEQSELLEKTIDKTITVFKSSVSNNAQEIKETALRSNYTRADICDNDAASNEELKESLKPVLEKSKDVLNAYGITDEILKEIFSDDVDANSIILAIAIAETDIENPATRSQVANCALDALGIPAGLLVGSAKSLTKKAVLKAARKLATRSLGWVGAAIAVVDFASCMDYI